jgi:hypothetical protein
MVLILQGQNRNTTLWIFLTKKNLYQEMERANAAMDKMLSLSYPTLRSPLPSPLYPAPPFLSHSLTRIYR